MRVTLDQLPEALAGRAGASIAYCGGCFDRFHDGHRTLLERARQEGDVVIVAVAGDEYVQRKKGADRPREGIDRRIASVLDTGLADYVFEVPPHGDAWTFYANLYRTLGVGVMVTGDDEMTEIKRSHAAELGIRLEVIAKTHSSSAIIAAEDAAAGDA